VALLVCLGAAALMGATAANAAPAAPVPGLPSELQALMAVQQAKLTAADGAAHDAFGTSAAISGDTAVVGASGQGSAYVFTRSGSVWSLQQKLTAADGGGGDSFGNSVAISGDTVVVGAYGDAVDGGYAEQGSAYVFTRSGSTWSQQQKLTAADGADGDSFGTSVGISGDTAVVGAFRDEVGANSSQGSAYVFTRSGGVWSQQQQLTAADGAAYDRFGTSVAISGDTVVVGACWDDVGGNSTQGSAYVFTRSGSTWSQQQKLTAADGAEEDYFGWSVAISGDIAVVGVAFAGYGTAAEHGSAYVYTRSGSTWSQQQKLTAADGADGDSFGTSVAISGDTVVVGAEEDDVGATYDQGSAYVFTRSGSVWSLQQQLTAADGRWVDYFGTSVAISGDTVVVGASGDHVGANPDQGSAYVFAGGAPPPAPTVTGFLPTSGPVGTKVTITGTGFSGATAVRFHGIAATSFTPVSATRVTATVPTGATSGPIRVTTPAGTGTSVASFTVTAPPTTKPAITKLTPTSGKRKATVTITGTGFGTTRGTGIVKFGAKKCSSYLFWSGTKIKCKVPATAVYGSLSVKVTTATGTSNGKSFRVKR
jgi:dihydroxyacetone kinase DhaKLM complex PTS-EIIA-like component DhaM